mgnify:CR=1 FL=1
MSFNVIGKPVQRGDAAAKVTGRALYTRDMKMPGMLYAKILRAEIAHGYVKSYDISEAEKLPGVVKIVLPKDVKANPWPSAGHPYSLNPAHQDIADRQILNEKIRLFGDEIGAVVAKDELTAEKAVKLIKVAYEALPFVLDAEEAMKEGAPILHGDETNILRHTDIKHGKEELSTAFSKCDYILEQEFDVTPVQHAHLENHIAYAYVDPEDRLTIVTSTQIAHIVRRVVAHALNLPFGKVRVIQPYIGGGFGNKQDVVIEPMAAMLSLACNGRPVMVDLTREEVFYGSRTRHGIRFKFKTGVSKDGRLLAKSMVSIGNNGAYASHGHSIVAKGGTNFSRTYPAELATEWNGYTVYTNTATAGAMRGYGIPQVNFAVECHMDDLADDIGMDPIEFKQKNVMKLGFVDPVSGIEIKSCGLPECIEKGKAYIDWDNKRKEYLNQKGDKRKGVGFALFSYATAVWPFSMELAGARLTMNQDGSLQLTVGAAEIGQGSDTVFAQMAAEVMGVPFSMVNVVRGTDTDIHPYDPGAYASRQTYVAGQAVRQAAESVRDQVCARAAKKYDIDVKDVEIRDAKIYRVSAGRLLCTLEQLAMESFYEKDESSTIASEKSANVKSNALAFGVCVTEVEVDVKTGKVNILKICNIHDSGTIINPILASGQVEGGMSMSCGLALSEGLKYDPKTGQMLTDNLLDYKLPTVLDTPHFDVDFVEPYDVTGPFGNKALGEPPAVPPAAAIRNAIKHATGVRVFATPMNPQSLFEAFREAGLN